MELRGGGCQNLAPSRLNLDGKQLAADVREHEILVLFSLTVPGEIKIHTTGSMGNTLEPTPHAVHSDINMSINPGTNVISHQSLLLRALGLSRAFIILVFPSVAVTRIALVRTHLYH